MEEIQSKLSEAIEQLAIQSIMIEPEDMMTLGSILEQLEAIEKICAENGFHTVQKLSNALKIVVEKIILKEFQESQEGLSLLGAGIKLIQQKIDHPEEKTLPSPEEETFWKKMGALGIVEKPAPSLPKRRPPKGRLLPTNPPESLRMWNSTRTSSQRPWNIWERSN